MSPAFFAFLFVIRDKISRKGSKKRKVRKTLFADNFFCHTNTAYCLKNDRYLAMWDNNSFIYRLFAPGLLRSHWLQLSP